jgi:hypothetical protein
MIKQTKQQSQIRDEVDLRVERYEFKTQPKDNIVLAMLQAARDAEIMLYYTINGALQLDLRNLWGQFNLDLKYPEHDQEGKDIQAEWRSQRWMIPLEAYLTGVDWLPFDQMQKFIVKCEAREIESKQVGIIKMDAFVPKGYKITGRDRTGCLIDIIHRHKNYVISAQTATIRVPVANLKEGISRCYLHTTFDEKIRLSSFGLSEAREVIQFKDIDIEDRCHDARYRDR